jgi:hypothetical protein
MPCRVEAGQSMELTLQIANCPDAQTCPLGQLLLGKTERVAVVLEQGAKGRRIDLSHALSVPIENRCAADTPFSVAG